IMRYIKVTGSNVEVFNGNPEYPGAVLIASNVKQVDIENTPESGTLNIKKVDSQDNTKLLEGAEFKLVQGDKV
ncbi:hypothetical protein, partial [Macrococcus capreoli]|uniref:hypothetical protein n=1 Tax=Macrococcus capreoli TaxID=2982690 RepID=UPI003EE57ECB